MIDMREVVGSKLGFERHVCKYFLSFFFCNGDEKSLRHVAMVAKFLDDEEPKIHLKSEFILFQTSSIAFNFT